MRHQPRGTEPRQEPSKPKDTVRREQEKTEHKQWNQLCVSKVANSQGRGKAGVQTGESDQPRKEQLLLSL